jgi:transaldolase
LIASGRLAKLIDQGLGGVTSNPTIFEKAIVDTETYDLQLRSLAAKESGAEKLFWDVAITDVVDALDLFRPVFEARGSGDGFVSLEVSPLLAHDTQATIALAKDLWQRVGHPNVMVKIPGTPEGMPAIEESVAAGININVTLVFSVEVYEQAARAYIRGLERRVKAGQDIGVLASANSLFISRIDTAVDALLEEKIAAGRRVKHLLGQAGLAVAKLTYRKFEDIFLGSEFAAIRKAGGRVQRPLWASTGTKNPRYPDLMYVEPLVGPETINTMPLKTLEALLDHGSISPATVREGAEQARAVMNELEQEGISVRQIAQTLQDEGVAKFSESYAALLGAISETALQTPRLTPPFSSMR